MLCLRQIYIGFIHGHRITFFVGNLFYKSFNSSTAILSIYRHDALRVSTTILGRENVGVRLYIKLYLFKALFLQYMYQLKYVYLKRLSTESLRYIYKKERTIVEIIAVISSYWALLIFFWQIHSGYVNDNVIYKHIHTHIHNTRVYK